MGVVSLGAGGCARAPEPVAADAPWSAAELRLIASLTPIPPPPPSPTNPVADDVRAAHLGQALFFDTGMSSNGVTPRGKPSGLASMSR